MNLRDRYEVRSVVRVEVVEIGLMLEVVGVDVAVLGSGVRRNIVVHNPDFERVALFLHQRLALLEDFGVRSGRRSDDDRLVVGRAAGAECGDCERGG